MKELNYQSSDDGCEYRFKSVRTNITYEHPVLLRIPVFSQIAYLHSMLKERDVAIKSKKLMGDFLPVSAWTEMACVSKKFKDIFEDKLKGHWYPTNRRNYFIFLLDNRLDVQSVFDMSQTTIVNETDKPYWYKSIDNLVFNKDLEQTQYLFTTDIEPSMKLCTPQFEALVKEHGLTGMQVYKDIDFKTKDSGRFDMFRFKKYDEDGNCLNK